MVECSEINYECGGVNVYLERLLWSNQFSQACHLCLFCKVLVARDKEVKRITKDFFLWNDFQESKKNNNNNK